MAVRDFTIDCVGGCINMVDTASAANFTERERDSTSRKWWNQLDQQCVVVTGTGYCQLGGVGRTYNNRDTGPSASTIDTCRDHLSKGNTRLPVVTYANIRMSDCFKNLL
ncbi:GSCOCG00005081001-RA-CDS [Cotesia congregata]|uniref:Uncharacterized protein n=1 Tax=Cotesia congregata TaxID=51543 RepID=A0A8J2HM35_COTCN|nr:GSCOCG00005081001-RA-CDS [Cotesia congregata]CAG5101254.1 Protein of unknown function [Cotesia congregata]